jgi:hypothetical protein
MRQLGVNYEQKPMAAMPARTSRHKLPGRVEMDYVHLNGEMH